MFYENKLFVIRYGNLMIVTQVDCTIVIQYIAVQCRIRLLSVVPCEGWYNFVCLQRTLQRNHVVDSVLDSIVEYITACAFCSIFAYRVTKISTVKRFLLKWLQHWALALCMACLLWIGVRVSEKANVRFGQCTGIVNNRVFKFISNNNIVFHYNVKVMIWIQSESLPEREMRHSCSHN